MIDYAAEAADCRTVNEFNRLHIKLDRTLAPAEIGHIARSADDPNFPAAGRIWLSVLRQRSPDLFEAPEPFERRRLSRRLTLYQASGWSWRKKLLVGFTGNANRMMVRAHEFLQCVPARAWDVALVKRRGRLSDAPDGGVENFEELLGEIETLRPGRYASVTTIGTSAGGALAIATALRWEARRGVSVCGWPNEALNGARDAKLSSARRPTTLRFVYGADFARDREAAVVMQRASGGEFRPVEGVADHNVLDVLFERRELKSFLAELL